MVRSPSLADKLRVLADAAKYDASCASSGARRATPSGGIGNATGMGICHSYTPDGRCVSLLKVLFTNYCIFDCQYCVHRISSDVERARFSVDEVVRITLDFYRHNYIEGLFLSSGVLRDPDTTMDLVTAVARQLRETHRFGGYIHLKAVAGASPELVEEAGRWADRVSVNIELPTEADLTRLAPEKRTADIEAAMARLHTRIAEHTAEKTAGAPRFAPAGQSTQVIVGATASDDRAYLARAESLYRRHRLRRVYYSAFSPIPSRDARLPAEPPPLAREHRLYEADWLMRFYGFSADELTPPDAPALDLAIDPKLAWALRNRAYYPIDINRAPREALLRVPGFGVRTVRRILALRRHRAVRLADLASLRVRVERARPFVITADHNPDALRIDRLDLRARVVRPQQLDLFAAIAGEL
jgi:putative DNA modification/repair radical SAM protein